MKTKTPYENLPLLPNIVAETVCSRPYKAEEWSEGVRSGSSITRIEDLRQKMTVDQIRDFSDLCDARCKAAYDGDAKWFLDCVKAGNNNGRDQLYIYLLHWMTAYLTDAEKFRSHCKI